MAKDAERPMAAIAACYSDPANRAALVSAIRDWERRNSRETDPPAQGEAAPAPSAPDGP